MTSRQEDRAGWTIQEAEKLLLSLTGVVSARLVTRPGGEVDEVHLLTTDEVTAKQTVADLFTRWEELEGIGQKTAGE